MVSAPHIVLVGGGHAMLPALLAGRTWTEAGARVTLINDHPFLYYSGMIPEYLGGVYSQEEVRIDLVSLSAKAGVTFVEGSVTQLDLAPQTITTQHGTQLSYDLAAFDIGARNPASPTRVVNTKPLHHVETLARHVASVLEGQQSRLRLVIAGGGAAGVEVALNLTGRFMAHDRLEALELHLVEAEDHILPQFPTSMSRHARDLLDARGVHLHLHRRVATVEDTHALLDSDRTLRADLVLWATGSVGPPLFQAAGLPCDPKGFLRVNRALQSPAHPCIFAAGDCATVQGFEDLAKVGVHAVKQGSTLRTNLTRALHQLQEGYTPKPDELESFTPHWVAPLILSTGTKEAIWVSNPLWFYGSLFLRLKHFLDQRWIRQYNPMPWNDMPFWRLFDAANAASI